jgi:hypothetical protein
MLRYHYERLSSGYVEALRTAVANGEIAELDPEVAAYALMGMGELTGMRWILWDQAGEMPERVIAELRRIISCVLERPA